ncbi:MAG TPA: hypothetical protein VFJ97_16060 [Dermatophilaceae bacterium]|nr:hypothetical protein [Dermatophilaceae bacterium]
MTTPDYTEFVLKGQHVAREVVEAHADAARAFAELAVPFTTPKATQFPTQLPEAGAFVDGVFDQAQKALGIQRTLAKRLVAAAG